MARLVNLAWAALLLYVLARWARELYGSWGRLIAVSLWCFEPTCIAYTGVVVPDVPCAAAGVLASYVYWKYLREPGWAMAAVAGFVLGLALSTKSIWLVLFGVWPVLFLCARLNPPTPAGPRPRVRHFLVVLPAAWLVFCTGYGFAKMGRPLGEFEFISSSLGGVKSPDPNRLPTPGNRFRGGTWENVPVPLPADVLAGVDIQKYDFEYRRHRLPARPVAANPWLAGPDTRDQSRERVRRPHRAARGDGDRGHHSGRRP